MDSKLFRRREECVWEIEPSGKMRVPAVIFASRDLLEDMDDKVREQLCNVASLPGIVRAAYAMPDAHWGYGFPIGGVAAFDADQGGIISAGGVGFDISCGIRCLRTNLNAIDLASKAVQLANSLNMTLASPSKESGIHVYCGTGRLKNLGLPGF